MGQDNSEHTCTRVIYMATKHHNQARFPLLLPLDLMEVIKKEAELSDRSLSAVVRIALKHYYTTVKQPQA